MRGLVRLLDALGPWTTSRLVASRVLGPTYVHSPFMHPGAGMAARVRFGVSHGVLLHRTIIVELRGEVIRQRVHYTELRIAFTSRGSTFLSCVHQGDAGLGQLEECEGEDACCMSVAQRLWEHHARARNTCW